MLNLRTPLSESFTDSHSSRSSSMLAFVVAGGVVALALAWFFALRPALTAYHAERQTSIEELKDRLAQRRASLAKFAAIDETFASITPEERGKLDAVLPRDAGVPELITNIEALVRLSGLTLDSLEVDAANDASASPLPAAGERAVPPGVRIYPITVQMQGLNYLTLKKFLQRVETNERLLDLPALTFVGSGEGLSVTLHAYTYRPPHVVQ